MIQWIREHDHLLRAWMWCLLAIPTVLWWKDSILWVAMMSLYANIESSLSAHKAEQARRKAEK